MKNYTTSPVESAIVSRDNRAMRNAVLRTRTIKMCRKAHPIGMAALAGGRVTTVRGFTHPDSHITIARVPAVTVVNTPRGPERRATSVDVRICLLCSRAIDTGAKWTREGSRWFPRPTAYDTERETPIELGHRPPTPPEETSRYVRSHRADDIPAMPDEHRETEEVLSGI